MRDRLYLKRLTTPSGNVAHEVVALVSAATVARVRERHEEAQRRARLREEYAREDARHRTRAAALARLCRDWWDAQARAIGSGSKAGW